MTVGELRVLLIADDVDFDRKLDKSEKRLRAFAQDIKPLKLTVATSDAIAKVDALQKRINSLSAKTVNVGAGVSAAGVASARANAAATKAQAAASIATTKALTSQALATAHVTQANANASAAQSRAALAAKKLDDALNGVSRSARNSYTMLNRIRDTALGVGLANVATMALGKAWDVAKGAVIDYNATAQQTVIGFTTAFKGNEAAAKNFYKSLQDLNDKSPLKESEIIPLAQQLMAMSIPAKEVRDSMKGIGDQVAALGKGADAFHGITIALGQINQSAHVQKQDLNQLVQHGVNGVKLLSQAYGVNQQTILKWVHDGVIPGREAFKALTNQMERNNFGAAERQAKSFTGVLSTLGDKLNRGLGGAAKGAFDRITELLNQINYLTGNHDFQAWAANVGETFHNAFTAAAAAVGWLYDAFKVTAPFAIGAMTAIGARALWLGAASLPAAMARGVAVLAALRTAFLATGGASVLMAGVVGVALAALVTDFGGIRSKLVDDWKSLTTWIARQYDGIAKFLNLEGGFEASVKATMSDVDKTVAGWKSSLGEKMKALNLNALLPQLPDADKWMAGYKSSSSVGTPPPAYKPKLGTDTSGAERAANKAAAAAKRLNLDQLQDTEKMYTAIADAAERSAQKQIDAINGVRDALRGFFDGIKDNFAEQGKSGAVDGIIAKYERILDLGGRKTSIIDNANGVITNARQRAGEAASARDKLQGGDGNNPQYSNGSGGSVSQTFSYVKKMLEDVGTVTGRVCGVEISHALRRAGFSRTATGYDPQWGGTGRRVRPNAQGQYPEGTIFHAAPGVAGYRRGHYMMGHYDQKGQMKILESNFYGKEDSGYVSYGRAFNARRASRMHAYLPPGVPVVYPTGGSLLNNISSTRLLAPVSTSPVGSQYAGAFNSALQKSLATDNDGRLSSLGKLPKEWGSELAKNEKDTHRFAAQIFLLSKEGQTFARDWKKAGHSLKEFRGDMNALDALNNKLSNTKAYAEHIKENQKAYQAHVKENRKEYLRNYGAQMRGIRKENVGLDKNDPTRSKGDAAIGALNERMANGEFDLVKKTEAGKAQIRELYARTRRNSYNAEKMALADGNKELRDRASLLGIESSALRTGRLSERELTDALEVEVFRRGQVAELLKMPGMKGERAVAIAKERAELFAGNKEMEREIALTREMNQAHLEATRARTASQSRNSIYSSTRFGSAEQARRLADADAMAELQKRRAQGDFNRDAGYDDAQGRPVQTFDSAKYNRAARDAKGAVLDAQLAEITANASQARLSARNSLLDSGLQLQMKSLEVNHQLSDVARAQLEFQAEIARRKGTTNEVTQEEIAANVQLLDIMRQQASLDFTAKIQGMTDQIDALSYKAGRDRDNYTRRRELDRDPNMTPEQRDSIYNQGTATSKAEEIDRKVQDINSRIRDTLSSSLEEGFRNGTAAGLKSFATGFLDMMRSRVIENMTDKLMNDVLGNVAGGLFKTHQKSYTPPIAPAFAPSFASFAPVSPPPTSRAMETPFSLGSGGIVGKVAELLGFGGGGDGATTLNAQIVNVRGNIVNVAGGAGGLTSLPQGGGSTTGQALSAFSSLIPYFGKG